MAYQVIPMGGGENYDWSKDHIYVKAALTLTDGRVTLVEDTLKPGFHLPRHHHRVMTEIFYILEGEIEFKFDNETVIARPGMTISISPLTWHDVQCVQGAKMLTVFSPGGFDQYLQELAALTPEQSADEAFVTALGEKYDTWMR
jgi:quercetin dioxygenase-like cupin family protein